MREIKFSYIWSNGKSFMDLRHTLSQIEFGLNVAKLDDEVLSDYKIIARRQYTGTKDKNGKEIYVGDIVAWSKEYPAFEVTSCCMDLSEHTNLEVIGNIYENPELLEVSDG